MIDIEAIEWLQQIRDKYIHGGDEWFDEQRCRAIEYAIECIYKRSKWIPVSERLPDTQVEVLTYSECNGVRSACLLASDDETNMRYLCRTDKLSIAVTHWMPLPNPPKEVDK